jgi:hypothetical protein
MRLPSILDLLSAVRRVAREHPEARTWWLTPRARLPVKGETSLAERAVRVIDLGIEVGANGAAVALAGEAARIERELSDLLPGTMINVRVLGPGEHQGMMRLLSADDSARDADKPVPVTDNAEANPLNDVARAQA